MTPYIEQLGLFVLITSHPRWSLVQKRSPRFSPLARTRGRKVNTWVSWSGFNLLGKFGTTDAAHLLSSRPSVPSPVCPWVNVRTVLLKKKISGRSITIGKNWAVALGPGFWRLSGIQTVNLQDHELSNGLGFLDYGYVMLIIIDCRIRYDIFRVLSWWESRSNVELTYETCTRHYNCEGGGWWKDLNEI